MSRIRCQLRFEIWRYHIHLIPNLLVYKSCTADNLYKSWCIEFQWIVFAFGVQFYLKEVIASGL